MIGDTIRSLQLLSSCLVHYFQLFTFSLSLFDFILLSLFLSSNRPLLTLVSLTRSLSSLLFFCRSYYQSSNIDLH